MCVGLEKMSSWVCVFQETNLLTVHDRRKSYCPPHVAQGEIDVWVLVQSTSSEDVLFQKPDIEILSPESTV